MKEHLISLETAKLAKEKGFDIVNVYKFYKYYPGSITLTDKRDDYFNPLKDYLAPTQALLQKWLREEYKKHVIATPVVWSNPGVSKGQLCTNNILRWTYNLQDLTIGIYGNIGGHYCNQEREYFDSYEEALEEGILKCLTLIIKAIELCQKV